MIGQEFEGVTKPVGFDCGKVASQGKNVILLQPREDKLVCMHNPCKAGCPSLKLQPSDVALDGLSTPCMASCPYLDKPTSHIHDMQQTKDIREPQPEPTPTALNLTMALSLDQNSLTSTPKDLDLSLSPIPQSIPHLLATPTMNNHAFSLQDHDQEMENLEQI